MEVKMEVKEVKMEVNSLRSWELCATHRTIGFNSSRFVQHESA